VRSIIFLAAALLVAAPAAQAQQGATVSVTVKNHRFQPSQLTAPANVPITIRVRNQDSTRMEFESVSLRVERVIAGNSEGVIQIRPLAPGRYDFFDDFNQEAEGVLVVR
jgi:Cupredoxin-like domain